MTSYLQQRTLYAPQIQGRPSLNLGIIVVIPAYDEPFLLLSLMSLQKCALPQCDVEVIVVVNESERAAPEIRARNEQIAAQAKEWALKNNHPRRRFHILHHQLPAKHAGVGLARKIGMDEACWRFERMGNPTGVITCFDADTRCTANYFQAIEQHFAENHPCPACTLYYEHPLTGVDYEPSVYRAITEYELHLRYYIQAQRHAGFPHAYHTVGSSMAVRADVYQKQGGMNRRKAGEDFYFIHKFTLLPGFSEIKTTRVIPSARPSHRVPFGTGKAVGELIRQKESYRTYAWETFGELRLFLQALPTLYTKGVAAVDLPPTLTAFLAEQSFDQKLAELKKHSSSYETFQNRFFHWFSAFMVMKYAHFVRERGREDIPVEQAARTLLHKMGIPTDSGDTQQLLGLLRELDRKDHMP